MSLEWPVGKGDVIEKDDDDDGEKDDEGWVQDGDAADDDIGESDEYEVYCSSGEDAISGGDAILVVVKELTLMMLARSLFGGIGMVKEAETWIE